MRQMPWCWMPALTWPQLFSHLILILSFFSHLILPSLLTFISSLSPLLWTLFIFVQLTQDLQSHKHSRASPACWNPVSLWIFVDSTIQWASAFWWLSYFFMPLSNILCIIGYLCCYNFLFLCQAYVWYSILHFLWHSVEAKRMEPGVRKSVAWTLFDMWTVWTSDFVFQHCSFLVCKL